MWKLYGQRGVAVWSTVDKIRKALELGGVRQGIVSPVRYVRVPLGQESDDVSDEFGLLEPANLPRPYLFKDAGFRIEEEIRFVIAANPWVMNDLRDGVIFNFAAQSIICDFEISVEIPGDERRCIELLANKLLEAPVPAETFRPWDENEVSGYFYHEPDLPPGIFPDLD
jgi:hypothetical protein